MSKTPKSTILAETSTENFVTNDSFSKRCFFITPIGPEGSDIRRATDGLIDSVILPVLAEFEFNVVIPHRVTSPGTITKQIIKDIIDCELVIANLTGLNPNVMYEMAVRHAAQKPIIIMAQQGTNLPFDILSERTLFYQNDMAGVHKLMGELREFIPDALDDENISNPIVNAVESFKIQKLAEKDVKEGDINSYIITRLDEIASQVGVLNQQTSKLSSINKFNVEYKTIIEFDTYPEEINKVLKQMMVTKLIRTFFVKTLDDRTAAEVKLFSPSPIEEKFLQLQLMKYKFTVKSVNVVIRQD